MRKNYTRQDLTGKKTGRLTVIGFSHSEGNPSYITVWDCKCECGKVIKVRIGAINSNKIKSCKKCSVKDRVLPHKKHPLYHIWSSMKDRCSNHNVSNYHRYGGRGIRVCDEWINDYEAFYEYSIKLYKEGLQIDRINNDGNYEPNNIRWVTNAKNMRNSSMAILTEEKVLQIRKSDEQVSELAKEYGVAKSTIFGIRNKTSWKNI